MAEAILFMESGVTDPTQPDDPAWVQADSPMIQTDMKPANILLDTPETTQSWVRIYPKPLLADFGGVLRLSNAHTIRGQGGTWGFTPFVSQLPTIPLLQDAHLAATQQRAVLQVVPQHFSIRPPFPIPTAS